MMDLKKSLYEILFGAIQEGLILVDKDGVIVEANKTGALMFGYDKADLIGQRIEVLVPMRAREAHKNHRDIYSKRPTSSPMGSRLKLDGVRKDGCEFPVELTVNTFVLAGGESYQMTSVCAVKERRVGQSGL